MPTLQKEEKLLVKCQGNETSRNKYQDLGRRKGGMCSFVFADALLTVGTDRLGLLVLFPNDAWGRDQWEP